MIPYFIFFFFIAFLSLMSNVDGFRRYRLYFFFVTVFFLILFAGLRSPGVGLDDWNYIYKFLEIPDISYWISGEYIYTFEKAWMEPSYLIVGATIRLFSNDPMYLFLIIAFLSVGLASYNYYKLTEFSFLTLLLFFVHTFLYRDINQIRAAVAAAIGLFLVDSIFNKNKTKTIGIILLASSFHVAALSYFLVFFLSYFPFSRVRMFVILCISIILGWVGVSGVFLDLLPGLGFVTTKLSDYSTNSVYADSVELFDLTNIKNIFFFIVLLFFGNRIEIKNKYFNTMMLFYFLAVTWRILFSDFGIFSARVSTFFGIVEVILIPFLLYCFKNKLLPCLFIIAYAFFTLYINLYLKEGRYPYVIINSII
ncbi:EpsG family protein [Pectobacterium polonicum]|uniref:EpsG family protein n=1 Tax=Pectobacterium polonicum TaxID=2485124 RepID=UPI002B244F8D|nr:EpsG family protein [Pectobacterium polonicum]